jgi:hypothetical protein
MQMAASHTMKKMYTAKPTPPPQNQHQDSETEDCFKNGRIQDSEAELALFHGQILFSRPYHLVSKAKPFFRSHLAKRPLASFFAIKRPPRY